MLGLLSDIKEFFSLLLNLSDYIVLGAMVAALGWLASRLFDKSLAGLLGAMAVGAVLTVSAVIGDWLGDDSDKIKRLEAELEAKTAQLGIERATNDELEKHLAAEAGISEHNASVIANLHKQIDAMEDKPECGVSKDFTDALKDIR